ncbi:MAG: hypothetical protein QOD53_2509, partial [Thermoleophilaceae bacterium]|nr:hypothetical protein [Thermoleophilaceae bacterium]
ARAKHSKRIAGVSVRTHLAHRHRHAKRHVRRAAQRVRVTHPARVAAAQRRAARRYRRLRARGPARPRTQARATVFSGLNAAGYAYPLSFGQPTGGYSSPSDSTGAVGPSNYVEIVNTKVIVYDRALQQAATPTELDTFVQATGSAGSGDPQIQWDPQSGRWYYLTYDSDGSSGGGLDFGWSKTASPLPLSTGWCKFQLSTGTLFPDFPKLGHDDTHLIFGANLFPAADETAGAVTAAIFSVPKPGPPAQGDTCTAPTATQFGTAANPLHTAAGNDAFAPNPTNTADSSSAGYVVAAEFPDDFATGCATDSAIQIWHVSGSPAVLTQDGEPTVPQYCFPGAAPQPGTGNQLDTLNAQLTQAVAHADPGAGGQEAVWTQHTVNGPGSRSVVRWYELVPAAPAASKARQVGTISDPSSFAFNAAISPAGNGSDAAIFYNVSGPNQRPAILASVRTAADAAGTMGHPSTIATSASSFGDFTCDPQSFPSTPCRWGDYPGASPDPLNDTVVWGTSQYSGGVRWLTRNFAVQFQPGGPTAALAATPNPALTGQTVTYDSSGTTDPPDATIVDHHWDLDGDGVFETGTGTSPTATRAYATAGTVVARVRVTDSYGDQSTAAATVTVNAPPPPPPSAACLKARKRRDQLIRSVKKLKNRIKHSHSSRSKQRYKKSLKHRKAQLRTARKAVKKACA